MPTVVPRETQTLSAAQAGGTFAPKQSAVQRAIAAISQPKAAEPLVPAQVVSEVTPEPIAESAPATQSAPVEEALSPKLIELARREKLYLKRQEELKAREAALAAKEAEYKTGFIDKKSLAANPVQALLDAGLTHDQVVQQLLNGPQQVDPNLSAIQAKLAAIEAAQEASKKLAEETQAKQYENAVNQIRNDVKNLVDTNA